MLNYLVFGIAIIIFATVIIISGKAISRGIEAKQNMKHKSEDEKIAISEMDYYYSNVIARASKTMSECKNSLLKLMKTGTDG